MHPCVFIVFSFLLLRLETTTANQLLAVEGNDNGVINKCLDKERHALLLFKANLQDLYDTLSTWTSEEDECCRWSGVTCDNQTGRVTQLKIRNRGLVGEISDSLLNLSYLNHLDLSDNSFHGTIPTFIGSLTELRYLVLSDNSFYGTIPSEFGNLTNLQHLYLGDIGRCRVENLEWLSHLSHLENLNMEGISLAKQNYWVNVILSLRKLSLLFLWGCDLSQVMYPYSSFGNSSSIKYLLLGNNSLNSSMYRWLFPLTSNKLSVLVLSENMLDGIPTYLGNLCSLETLYFDNNSVFKFPGFLNNLSGCTSLSLQELSASYNEITGSLPDEIQKFSFLKHLDLSENKLEGTLSEKLWELPRLTYLDLSSNYLRGAISGNIEKLKSITTNVSSNKLERVTSTFTDNMLNLSNVQYFDMSSCMLGPHFPKWIQTLKKLALIHIADNNISDSIPLEFWDMWPSQLKYLNLSSNNINGKVPDLSSNFDAYSVIDLSSNNFSGPVPNLSSTLQSLNLSRNKFSGGLSFLCQIIDGFSIEFLDLSHNHLTGQLPDCLWLFKELQVLNLGHNNLFGRLPTSVGSLINLEAMYLYNNSFSGELPLLLKNCTSLNSLNLGANNFSGDVPVWIGENLSGLYALILGSNNFFGTIPVQLCQLEDLQILDLSMNNLHGTIPSCLNNLTSMVQQGIFLPQSVHTIITSWTTPVAGYDYRIDYVDNAIIEWQGDKREFSSNLILLKIIDLSNNNLTGEIPHELTNLDELLLLNLSQNALFGEIPQEVGKMKKLLSLDLSRNSFSGGIPSSMSQMSFLNDLDLSFNNLSGPIPSSTQLQSFAPSRYDGNAGLCGPPLTKRCPGHEESKVAPVISESDGGYEYIDELERWFYVGGCSGFATGFWIAIGALLLNRRGRHVFSVFLDSLNDWVYVKLAVFIANLQNVRHN